MKFKEINFIDFESKNVLTKKTWLVILMAIVVYFVYTIGTAFSSVFIGIIYGMTAQAPSIEEFLESNLVNIFSLFITVLGIILSLIYVKFIEKRNLRTTGIIKKGFCRQYSIGYVIGIGMISVSALALLIWNGKIYVNANAQYGILLLYFLGFLVQGASEEIMIRGYLFTSLAKSSNIFWAVSISSVFFAAMHLLNPNMEVLPFINLVLFGVFACFFFMRTKNIWAISAIHSAWNFFQGNVFGIEVSGKIFANSVFNIKSACPAILSGGNFGLEGGLIVSIVLVSATLVTIFAGKNRLVETRTLIDDNIQLG